MLMFVLIIYYIIAKDIF